MTSTMRLTNREARALFLQAHHLATPLKGPATGTHLAGLVHDLGFVQMDSVNTLARAHDLILWSRRPRYRAASLRWLNDRARLTFEGWTHDAAIIPVDFFPFWRLKFARDQAALERKWPKWRGPDFKREVDTVLSVIKERGAVCSRDFKGPDTASGTGWWDWHPSKTALEFLWRSGRLALCHRTGFTKHYDLVERVIPAEHLNAYRSDAQTIDWACTAALDRLGFATPGELAAFWAIVTPQEAKAWVEDGLRSGRLVGVDVVCVDGTARRCVGWPERFAACPAPSTARRVRILSPFDPALRDRKRAERLFGFSYRIEIFVPAHKRRYGYYVFPVLRGQSFIGRIDVEARRADKHLFIRAFWPETRSGLSESVARELRAELLRMATWQGLDGLEFAPGWRKQMV